MAILEFNLASCFCSLFLGLPILLHEKFDWLRAEASQLNLNYLCVKITVIKATKITNVNNLIV